MPRIKNKTCITVTTPINLAGFTTFTDNINIQHKVDLIIVKTLGGYMPDPLDENIYYVRSNLVSSIHDNILGVFGNPNSLTQSTRNKTFKNIPSTYINSTYNFDVCVLGEQSVFSSTGTWKIYIDLEFVELDIKP